MDDNHLSQSMLVLVPHSGNLYQILKWYLRIGAKISLHQILPFQMSHVPLPGSPPPRETVTWPKKHRKYWAPKAPKKIFLSVTLEFGGGASPLPPGDRHALGGDCKGEGVPRVCPRHTHWGMGHGCVGLPERRGTTERPACPSGYMSPCAGSATAACVTVRTEATARWGMPQPHAGAWLSPPWTCPFRIGVLHAAQGSGFFDSLLRIMPHGRGEGGGGGAPVSAWLVASTSPAGPLRWAGP